MNRLIASFAGLALLASPMIASAQPVNRPAKVLVHKKGHANRPLGRHHHHRQHGRRHAMNPGK